MRTPDDQYYNTNYYNELNLITLNIDQLIQILVEAKKRMGGRALVMLSFDSGAGYEELKSIFAQDFHGDLILNISGADFDDIKHKSLEYFGGIGGIDSRFND